MRPDSDIQHRTFREIAAVAANIGVVVVKSALTLATAVADATHVDPGYGVATPVYRASVLGDKISIHIAHLPRTTSGSGVVIAPDGNARTVLRLLLLTETRGTVLLPPTATHLCEGMKFHCADIRIHGH